MEDNKFKGTEEQWLSDGICGKCRRNTYCSKDCKAAKKRLQKIMIDAMREAAPELTETMENVQIGW